MTATHVPEPVDGMVIDVSFISLEKVLPFTGSFVKEGGILVALIKPQFELEKRFLNKHGVVKSTSVYPEILKRIEKSAKDSHFEVNGIIDSPIIGGDGNKEFLMFATKK